MDILTALYLQWLITTLYRTFPKEQQIRTRVGWEENLSYFTTYCAFQEHADLKIQRSTDNCVFRYGQSNVRRRLPASDFCWTCGNQIKSLSTVQTTKQYSAVVGSWEEQPNIWLAVAKNAFVGWALNFRVRMVLKGAVTNCRTKPSYVTLAVTLARSLVSRSSPWIFKEKIDCWQSTSDRAFD